MKRIIIIWYRAIFLDYWYWRVEYKDGKKTRKLSYGEARSLQQCFSGKIYIDYSVKIIALCVLFLSVSCKTNYVTKYKVITPKGNFYVDYMEIANDSVYLVEFNRNGDIRRNGAFKESEVIIKH